MGAHAYSLLDACFLPFEVVGSHSSLLSFFHLLGEDGGGGGGGGGGEGGAWGGERGYRLVKLRNPWGEGEWQGAFSRNSHQMTKQLEKYLKNKNNVDNNCTYGGGKDCKKLENQENQEKEDDQGTFWMPFCDFVRYFDQIDVCKAHRDWFVFLY